MTDPERSHSCLSPSLADEPERGPLPNHVGWARQTLAALRLLTVSQRAVIHLAYFERLSQEEIAVRLGMPMGTVRATAAEALQRVAVAIEADPPSTDGI